MQKKIHSVKKNVIVMLCDKAHEAGLQLNLPNLKNLT